MHAAIGIVKEITKFPLKIAKEEGELLKEYFEFEKKLLNEQNDVKNLQYRYTKEIDGEMYILLEEFMFRDGDADLDIRRSIGCNYYLNKKTTTIPITDKI